MKGFLKLILSIAIIIGIGFGIKVLISTIRTNNQIAKVKEGWHVEIVIDELNVRDKAGLYEGAVVGKVHKGEVYAAEEVVIGTDNHYWFKIKWNKGYGWIGMKKSSPTEYFLDINNEKDYATPLISYKNDEYHVISINDINYNHLTIWDDQPGYEVTHIIYHEYNITSIPVKNQYWIKYIVTDKTGKTASKMQKITFEETPSDDLVEKM